MSTHVKSFMYIFCIIMLTTNIELGDNCVQNFNLGRYIVGYTVGNLVLRRRVSGAVKRDFRTYIRRYSSKIFFFEYGYPHSNALLQFCLKLKRCEPHKAARHSKKCDVINDVNYLLLDVIQSRYKSIWIRIDHILSRLAPSNWFKPFSKLFY